MTSSAAARAERPLAACACAREVDDEARGDEQGGVNQLALKVWAHEEDVGEAARRGDGRGGVEPHPERPRHLWPPPPKDYDADGLREELHDDAYDDERGDHFREPEEAEGRRDQPKHEQRDVREVTARMHARERAEVVSILRRREGNARVAEQ